LREQGRFDRVVQGLGERDQQYLIMHVVASALLDAHPDKYSMLLQRAEDTALSLHAALGWRKRHLYARLALTPCPSAHWLPALVKLRGGDRRVTEQGLARHWLYRRSMLARYLPINPT
jgi:hypothetical protein